MPIWYGGDYNPEQWPEDVWAEDVQLMQRGGISMATVGVFSWARLEPRDGHFDFAWLDRVLDLLHKGGVRVDLATATASPPPWLSAKHPEMLPVTEQGVTLWPGSRQAYCPSSPIYREHAARLVATLVERYADHPALELWHVNNEYGCHVNRCYCDVSAAAFRRWLEARYSDIHALNHAWGTAFWSQGYDSFDEVLPPRSTPSFMNPTQLLDFDRFSSNELLDCYRSEASIIRAGSSVPITTNFMGFFKPLDYWAWAKEVDLVSDDSYPDPADPDSVAYASMQRDLIRSLAGGEPWILMEQATSAVNWRRSNATKAPGQMRAWSYQAVARGADGILFFQWRQAKAGAEKFHSALVPHAGTDTRVWREVEDFGGELRRVGDRLAGSQVEAAVAIVLDWDSWWAVEQAASPTAVPYLDNVFAWHRALTAAGVVVDFVPADGEISGYGAVVVPSLFVATDEQLDNLDGYAREGGTLVVSFATAVLDENLHARLGGYLGALQSTLGLSIEEFSPPAAPDLAARGLGTPPAVAITGDLIGGEATGTVWAEALRVSDAEVLASFGEGALTGSPAVTRNEVGEGAAWYVATQPDAAALQAIVAAVLDGAAIARAASLGDEVEVVRRGDLTYVINHGADPVRLELEGRDILSRAMAQGLVLEPQGVAILEAGERR